MRRAENEPDGPGIGRLDPLDDIIALPVGRTDRRIADRLERVANIGGGQFAPVVKDNPFSKVKRIPLPFLFGLPALGQIGRDLGGVVDPDEARKEELSDPLGVGVGRVAGVKVGRERLDGDDEGRSLRDRDAGCQEEEEKERNLPRPT